MVVVGAGAAGLSATRELRRRGATVATLEASSRIGGRAHTDLTRFGVPYDIGAHWLHNAASNPFVKHAKDNGFTVYPAPDTETLYVGDREASDEEYSAFDAAYRNAIGAISAAGRRGRDVSPASVVPDGGKWHDLVHFVIGPWEMGKDFDTFSCADWWSGEDGADWYCEEGYGTLVAHRARDLDVHLSARVQSIDWSGSGVAVETGKGRVRAKACIVTVSTGVLASGDLRFVPALPEEKVESFHGISMGHYDHIALFFDENVFGTGPDEYLLYNADSHGAHSPALMGLLTNVSGTGLTLAEVGGDFARELEEGGRGGGDRLRALGAAQDVRRRHRPAPRPGPLHPVGDTTRSRAAPTRRPSRAPTACAPCSAVRSATGCGSPARRAAPPSGRRSPAPTSPAGAPPWDVAAALPTM